MIDTSHDVSTARVGARNGAAMSVDGHWQTDYIAEGLEAFLIALADESRIPAHARA